MKRAGSQHIFPPISRSTVWTTSSDIWIVVQAQLSNRRVTLTPWPPPPPPLHPQPQKTTSLLEPLMQLRCGVGQCGVSGPDAGAAAVVGAPLTDITMSTKSMSVVSVTSQCSYSSTIGHVPQPESEAMALEDVPMGSEPADAAPTSIRAAPSPATEERRFIGLNKEVLSAHTQKEMQEYVDRFRHRILQSPYSSYLQLDNSSMAHSHHPGDYRRPVNAGGLNCSRRGKPRHKRPKPQGSSDSYTSPAGPTRRVPDSSWPSSESSQPYSQTSPLQAPFFPMMANQPGLEQPPRP